MVTKVARIEFLVHQISRDPECEVMSPAGYPRVESQHTLPTDLLSFYALAGGSNLFVSADYSTRIVAPSELVLANPVIVGEHIDDDISSSWYIVAKQGESGFITIDLDSNRLGRCYDSFWDRHGVAGSCAVIAVSFTDLLTQLVAARGRELFWLGTDFPSLGDAYDAMSR